MRVSDFQFDLPDDRIAERPVEPRDAARMFVHFRAEDRSEHRQVRHLGSFLAPGDLLILNDTKVLPHRLIGRRATGGRSELLVLERDGELARGYLKPAKKARIGESQPFEEGRILAEPTESLGGGLFRLRLSTPDGSDLDATLAEVGRAPLPPYIRRADEEDPASDRERYQTVFANKPGAVAAPTAGLHFTPELLAELEDKGVHQAFVTLHVGEGTFSPIRVEDVEAHDMHSEVYDLPVETADAIAATKAAGNRVVAVGTTAARVLESCVAPNGGVIPGAGATNLFLYPGRPLRVVDALLTNFHLPESTLLMLIAAFCGRDRILRLYDEAIAEGYRFYSYGDAMLLL